MNEFDWVLRLLFAVGFVIGSSIRWRYSRGHRRERSRPHFGGPLDTALVLLAGVGLMLPVVYLPTSWLDFADYDAPRWAELAAGLAGTAIFASALWLFWRSHTDLGRNWFPSLTVREGHTLVTGGVYNLVRHPMYAAHGLWALAQALMLHNWLVGPAFLVVFIPFYLVRVPREERMMIEQFGDEYREYMRRTGRMIPPMRPSTHEDKA